jgi:hypothetical protein
MPMTSLLLALAIQSPLSTVLDKKVSCEVLRAPLARILADLSTKSGIRIVFKFRNPDFNTTALIKDKPLRAVLEALASVHGLKVVENQDSVELVKSLSLSLQQSYINSENDLLLQRARQKLWALARLTNQAFGTHDQPAERKDDDDTPDGWARRRINQWPYYLAGMWQRLPQNKSASIRTSIPNGFWVGMPQSEKQNSFGRSWIDENSASLAGNQALFVVTPITYELRVAGVYPTITPPEPAQPRPYQCAAIPQELSKTAFAQYLQSWEADAVALSDPELDKDAARGTSANPEQWKNGGTSLAGLLYSIYKQNGVSIVADAYRIASLKGVDDIRGKTRRDLLLSLKSNEQCFLGYKDQIARVLHPGFWRLQQSEPTNASVTRIETKAAKGSLNLLDYAEFMANNEWFVHIRFDSAESCLFNFDIRPITESGPALISLGRLPSNARERIAAGDVNIWASGNAFFQETAMLGLFYNASVEGVSRLLLQAPETIYLYNRDYCYFRGYWSLLPPGSPPVIGPYLWLQSGSDLKNYNLAFGQTPRDYIVYHIAIR